MKVRDCFDLNPSGNTNKYTDYINYIDTASVNAGVLNGVAYLDENFPSRAQRLVLQGDILYSSVRPNLRHYYLYKDTFEHAVASTGFVLLRNKSDYNTEFAFYYLTTKEIVKHLSNIAELSQSTYPSFLPKDLGAINLPEIDIAEQEKIVSILSAYDNLIEVNNKRIKVLEQMAENLYKEWFVRFRFPGHETAEFENGIPKGWKLERLGNIANISTGKSNRQDADENGQYPFFDRSQEIKRSNIWIKDCEGIIVPGEGTKFFPRYYKGKFDLHQRCYCVEPKQQGIGKFLYYVLYLNRLYFLSVATGATVPSLRLNNFESMKFIMPQSEICKRFNQIVTDQFYLIDFYKKDTENLIKQRDLLLPRLMSGKLEV